ncbi:hypothetical protein, conserved [Plasmodium gonderi]|uniref:GPI transamidase subunit PIG-U n=1 Tax=Plasmodium gonderi TaxID=77519 RepID=A0A1Y1JKV2_PLAGO|nr:hypothetical protein, conserved [Plasmodium gonderi]GAW82258.1 hypothetical protein, conserved [Plasmodium gonderi]
MNERKAVNYTKCRRESRHWKLAATVLVCLIVRITAFFILYVLEGSEYEYINMLIRIKGDARPYENLHKINERFSHIETHYDLNAQGKRDTKIMAEYFQKNKRNRTLKQFILRNDAMHYSFNSDIYNLKYIYESYILSKMYADVYPSLTVRINPIFLNILHFLLLKEIAIKQNGCVGGDDKGGRNHSSDGNHSWRGRWCEIIDSLVNNPELRYFLLICVVDILTGIFLFLIVQCLETWKIYFHYVNHQDNQKKEWKLIDPILLINIYLNNPLSILSNSFLTFDNFKFLIITMSFYLTLKRNTIKFQFPLVSLLNLITILFLNALLLYVTSFHFILILIGINNFIIFFHQNLMNKHKIKDTVNFSQMFYILLQNLILLLSTIAMYVLLILASVHLNSGSLSFLNNTIINEYKILFLLPNLGNYWYLFSTMFQDYYHSFLFLFHFHLFLYPVPLLFRLVKTPLIYLKIMIAIALVFHPNITVGDIVFSLLLFIIDYERTIYAIPFAKLIIILLANLGLFFVTTNLWLRKNTGNANYAFFNQLAVFNITTFIITSSIKFYIRVQTPVKQLEEGKCIVVSRHKVKFSILRTLKETFS